MQMFSEWIRRNGFWILDGLKGSKVRKHLKDIEFIMENINDLRVKEIQDNYLKQILIYAKEKVPFYKGVNYTDLKSFPIVNKSIMKESYKDFQSLDFLDKKVIELHTSGSTGIPFAVRQDLNKRNRVYAEMMYFWEKAGFKIGMKYIYFRIWTDGNRKSKTDAWARNIIMHDILRTDKENLESVREVLKTQRKIKMLIGYASTFDLITTYLNNHGDTPEMFSIKTILSSAELLPESTRRKLKSVFGCNVVSLYSNQENGTLAQECIENTEFHLNTASYYFEFLKFDKDEPAELNEPARIVVTDLFNHAMPLIRYDTGDIALLKEHCDCGWNTKAVKVVQGRVLDCIYDTLGRVICPNTVTVYMWPFDKLLQFQFIQEDEKDYLIKLNGDKGIYDDNEIINVFKGVLGQDAKIRVEYVDEIPVLYSGKRKHVVCNYKPLNQNRGEDKQYACCINRS